MQLLQDYVSAGLLDRLELAFSRDGAEKDYVQHHLRKHSSALWKLVENGACIYVCGGTEMGNDVRKEFFGIAAREGKLSAVEAKERVAELQESGRYVQELWSSS